MVEWQRPLENINDDDDDDGFGKSDMSAECAARPLFSSSQLLLLTKMMMLALMVMPTMMLHQIWKIKTTGGRRTCVCLFGVKGANINDFMTENNEVL